MGYQMPNNSQRIQRESIKSLSETIRRAYAHARILGYTGSSLEYSMLVLPQDTTIIDSDGGYEGPIDQAPSVEELLNYRK